MALSAQERYLCVVTVHGVGFEQPPAPNVPMSGYADMLHARLSAALRDGAGPSLLGDDPTTQRPPTDDESSRPGAAGPVYVESAWKDPATNLPSREFGLKRLGKWKRPDGPRVVGDVDTNGAPLGQPGHPIAHVALVYSNLEGQGPQIGPAFETAAKAAFSIGHYATVVGAVHMLFKDITTALRHQQPSTNTGIQPNLDNLPTSLRVRRDAHSHVRPLLSLPHFGVPAVPPEQPRDGPGAVFLQLQEDVATYVCINALRQRVRSFVRDALLRLIYRADIAGIVVNAHSQGTVVAFDVLSQLSPFEASKVRWLVTAGSPLRKYIDLFSWEREVGSLRNMDLRTRAKPSVGSDGKPHLELRWTNFWDARDPVADPLGPEQWDPGSARPVASAEDHRLYRWVNPMTGADAWGDVEDREAHNVENSPDGGLKAHNYWDNEPDFIGPLAELLRREAHDLPGEPSPPPAVAGVARTRQRKA